MNIIYRKAAIDDLSELDAYITNQFHNSNSGRKIIKRITDTISLLKDNPNLGPKLSDRFKVKSTLHYLVVSKQIVFYDIKEETIEIIRVLDSRQDYISILF